MRHSVRHALEPSCAREVLGKALETYRQGYGEYDVETAWLDDERATVGFTMPGGKVQGTIRVGSDSYDIDLDLPLMLQPFSGRIVGMVDQELQRWIARA